MKRQKETYRSRKSRKKALHLRQFGTQNNPPGATQANRMIGNPINAIVKAVKRAARGI